MRALERFLKPTKSAQRVERARNGTMERKCIRTIGKQKLHIKIPTVSHNRQSTKVTDNTVWQKTNTIHKTGTILRWGITIYVRRYQQYAIQKEHTRKGQHMLKTQTQYLIVPKDPQGKGKKPNNTISHNSGTVPR